MKKIKLFDPVINKKEEITIKNILNSKFWASGAGTGKVLEFENKFKHYIDSDYCIAVNSGTAALHLALSIADIKNKEVILPSLSFVSTAHSVVYNGGKPVFVDIDPKTLCIDPEKIKNAISRHTAAILPVHFAGMPCQLKEIQKLCEESRCFLIEDAAHASGATYQKNRIGSHGDAVCFSFHPVKNLAMPTGGAIALNGKRSYKFDKILRSRRWCGISDRREFEYDVKEIGWNYYMNEFSAGIGIEQLKKLDKTNKKRKKIAKRYSDEIEIERKMPFSEECSYHIYWIQVKKRNSFMKIMKENGIETGIHYKPIHTMKCYSQKKILPVTDNISKDIVSIPIHPNLSESDIEKIIKSVNRFS
jgi:dTDP-4-amino-4,6-dideoxygalactose transaminase